MYLLVPCLSGPTLNIVMRAYIQQQLVLSACTQTLLRLPEGLSLMPAFITSLSCSKTHCLNQAGAS